MIFIDDDVVAVVPEVIEVPPELVPEAKAFKKKHTPKKKAAEKAPKRKAKVAKRTKGKSTLGKRRGRGGAPSAKTRGVRRGAGSRRGPKGNPPEKVLRKGDAVYGRKVAAARKAKGLRQWQLAEKMGVGQPSICNVERGTLAAGIGMQKLFKKHLGVPMTKACEAAIEKGHKSIVKSRK